jgi:hypothetical protein
LQLRTPELSHLIESSRRVSSEASEVERGVTLPVACMALLTGGGNEDWADAICYGKDSAELSVAQDVLCDL